MQVKSEGRVVSITRRQFVGGCALAAGAAAAGCTSHNGDFSFLTPDEAVTLAALCDQIIPADDYPSASQAGVVRYIDLQLTRPYRRHQDAFRAGLAQAESFSVRRFGAAVVRARRSSSWPRCGCWSSRTVGFSSCCVKLRWRGITAPPDTAAIETP